MPKFDFYPSFNAGEVSPFIDARTTLEKYRSACRTLENFQILPYGGAVRRPGMRFVGYPKLQGGRCRLIGFNFSTTTRFIIEMGSGYMRFWKDGALVTSGSFPFEVATPYLEADLRQIQFFQVNDIMYFAHASYPPYKLSRVADDNWTFALVEWDSPPLREVNITGTTIYATGTTGSVTLVASSSVFDAGHVGSQWRLAWRRQTGNAEIAITAANLVAATLDVKGSWDFTTYGTWNGVVQLLRTPYDTWKNGPVRQTVTRASTSATTATVAHTAHGFTSGDLVHFSEATNTSQFNTQAVLITVTSADTYTYPINSGGNDQLSGTVRVENLSQMEIVREYDSNGDRNIITSGDEIERAGLKLFVKTWASATNARVNLVVSDFTTGGQVKITAVASGTSATATVEEWLGPDAAGNRKTKLWYEAAFSAYRGYPRSVAMHEQRLCFGGSSGEPTTIWCSAIDDFENFQTGATASDAITFTLAASEGNRVNWLYSQSDLLVGTSGDEWTIGAADTAQALSASNVQANKQSSYGSKYMKAALVNDVLLFVQRNGRKVRELVYELNKDGWVAPDLTLLAEHITKGEIVELAYQQQPDAVLWCVRGDGALIALTYERDQKVVGWHRHVTDGIIESIATVYGYGTEDEVWMLVNRGGCRTLERFSLLWRTYLENGTTDAWRYLDAYTTSPPNSFAVTSVAVVGGKLEIVLADPAFTLEPAAGDLVTFAGVGGATGLNGTFKLKASSDGFGWVLTNPTTNAEIDATGWAAYTSGGTATWVGVYSAPQLAGKTVTIYKAGGIYDIATATNGRVPCATAPLAVGLPYVSTLRPMKLDMDLQDGSAQGRKKRIHGIVVRTFQSRGGEVRANNGDWYSLADAVTTGDQKVVLAGAYGIDADIEIAQIEPYPFVLIAIEPKWDAYGNE